MTALADTLRERASRRGRTAQVDCGALGTLTVEALPLRECAALARGPDGDRAVFYAACRELQAAGEALRRAGQVFAPDGVMQYVSDREAALAARAVLALSGVERQPDGPEVLEQADGPEGPEPADGAEVPGSGDSPAGAPRETADPGGAVRADGAAAPDGTAAGSSGQIAKTRLETVQDFVKQFSEIRPEDVQKQEAETAGPPVVRRKAGKDFREIRRGTVQTTPAGETAPAAEAGRDERPPENGGQVSHEFPKSLGKNGEARKSDKKTQSLVEKPEKRLQNVAEKTERRARETALGLAKRRETEGEGCEKEAELLGPLHEMTSESGGGPKADMHETASEAAGGAETEMHEIKSETPEVLHETTSETGRESVSKLHESRSEAQEAAHEIKSEFRDVPHEITSEFDGGAETEAHESRSEIREAVHEITSESARRMARLLLEGLRRAYTVR